MEKICAICAKEPSAHSFKKISEKNGVCTFYTKPAAATKYDDTAGVIAHIDNALRAIGNKKWIWIFDSDGFEAHHAMALQTGRGILQLIEQKYGTYLQQILFINNSWHIKAVVKAGSMTLDDSLRSKIKMLDDRVYSVLEFV
jgi:hypothetical protein